MATIAKLQAVLAADTSNLEEGFKRAEKTIDAFAGSVSSKIKRSNTAIESLGKAAGLTGEEIRKMQSSAGKSEAINAAERALAKYAQTTGASSAQLKDLAKSMGLSSSAIARLERQHSLSNKFNADAKAAINLKNAMAGIAGIAGGYVGIGGMVDIGKTAIDVASIQKTFYAITGGTQGAREEMSFLREEAQRLGLDFFALAESFKGFSAAGKTAQLEASQVKDIFLSVSEASTVLGLSSEKTKLTLYALEQMLSKGCHATGTLVLMADGTKKPVEDIQQGETLQGRNGEGRIVLIKASGIGKMYRITPTIPTIAPFEVNDNHIFPLYGGGFITASELYSNGHKEHQLNTIHKIPFRFVIEYIGCGEYHGFLLDGDHIYYTADGVEHHNSVSMEELRRQLGDQLPGAFAIGAKAMGLTTAEFGKLVESGDLASKDFLPKFAETLRNEYGHGLTEAIKTPRAEVQRLVNDLSLAKVAIGENGFLSGIKEGASSLHEAFNTKEVQANLIGLGESLGAITGGMAKITRLGLENVDAIKITVGAFATYKAATTAKELADKAYESQLRKNIVTELEAINVTKAKSIADKEAAQAAVAKAQIGVKNANANVHAAFGSFVWRGDSKGDASRINDLSKATHLLDMSHNKLAATQKTLAQNANVANHATRLLSGTMTTATKVGAGLMGALGGPFGLAITAATLGVGYLMTRESEAEKIAKSYGRTVHEVAQGYEEYRLKALDAGKATDGFANSMSSKNATLELKKLQAEIDVTQEKVKEGFAALSNPQAVFTKEEVIDHTTVLVDAFKAVPQEFKSEFEKAFKELETGNIVGAETILSTLLNKIPEAKSGLGAFAFESKRELGGFEDKVKSAIEQIKALGDAKNFLDGLINKMFDLKASTRALPDSVIEMQRNVKEQAEGIALANDLASKAPSAKKEEQTKEIARANAALLKGINNAKLAGKNEEIERLLKTQAQLNEYRNSLNKKTTGGGGGGGADSAKLGDYYRDAINQVEQLQTKNAELLATLKGSGLDAALAKNEKEFLATINALDKKKSELERALTSKKADSASKTDIQRGIEELEKAKATAQANKDINDQLARRVQLEKEAQAASVYHSLMGNLQGVYDAEYKLLAVKLESQNIDQERLATMEQMRIAAARRDFDIGGMFQTGWNEQTRTANQEAIDYYEKALPGAFGRSADAFGGFVGGVLSGSDSFTDGLEGMTKAGQRLLNDLIADFARAQMKALMFGQTMNQVGGGGGGLNVGSIGGIVGGLGGLLFGGGSSTFNGYNTGGLVSSPSFDMNYGGGGLFGASGMHSGGMVGIDSTFVRNVPMSLFENAKRYHTGGKILGQGEVPIIAKVGERVLNENQNRLWEQMALTGGSSNNVEVHIHDNRSNKSEAIDVQQAPTANGGMRIDVMVEDIVDAGIARGRFSNSLERGYGLKRQTGGRR